MTAGADVDLAVVNNAGLDDRVDELGPQPP
jgi:hypothetical protein